MYLCLYINTYITYKYINPYIYLQAQTRIRCVGSLCNKSNVCVTWIKPISDVTDWTNWIAAGMKTYLYLLSFTA